MASHHLNSGSTAGTRFMNTATNSNRVMPSLSNVEDIAVWLHNKLSSDDIWADKNSIISHLNPEVLRNIKRCFSDLQLNVKLKLLLSFLHISKRNLDDWKHEMRELINLAIDDSDNWVSVVAELLIDYPNDANIHINSSSSRFAELCSELKKQIKKHDPKSILPMESLFLNRNAFTNNFGNIPSPIKHFKLNRNAKSVALRTELLQKAADLSSGKRSSTSTTVPIRCRGLNSSDSTPLKGIPSRNYFQSYSSFGKQSTLSRLSSGSSGLGSASRSARLASVPSSSGIKRDGGIVFLDFTEAPSANQREVKRQKKEKTAATSTTTNTSTTTSTTKSITSKNTTSSVDQLDHEEISSLETSSIPSNPNDQKSKMKQSENVEHSSQSISQKTRKNTDQKNKNDTPILASKSTPDYAAGLLTLNNNDSLKMGTKSNLSVQESTNVLTNNNNNIFEQQMPTKETSQALIYSNQMQIRPSMTNNTINYNSNLSINNNDKTKLINQEQSQPQTGQNLQFSNYSGYPLPNQTNVLSPTNLPQQQTGQFLVNQLPANTISGTNINQYNSPNTHEQQSPMFRPQMQMYAQSNNQSQILPLTTNHTQTPKELLNEIQTKYPQLNPNDKSTIVDFLTCSNKIPKVGSRNILLGTSIELQRNPDNLKPIMRETRLIIDYANKICQKTENIKEMAEMEFIKAVQKMDGNVPGNQQIALQIVNNPIGAEGGNVQIPINVARMMNSPRSGGLTLMTFPQTRPIRPGTVLIRNPNNTSNIVQQRANNQQQSNQQIPYSQLQQRV